VLRRFRSHIPGLGQPSVSTLFAPAAERPASYPADLPFLSHTLTNLVEFESSARPPMLQFYHLTDLSGAIDSLLSQSKQRGWIHDSPPIQRAATNSEWLHPDNHRRHLIATTSAEKGMIWLLDMAEEES
jgi:hypothetical protein